MMHTALDYNIENFRGFSNPQIMMEFSTSEFDSELVRIQMLPKPLRDEIVTVLYRFTKQYSLDEFTEKIVSNSEFELMND